MHVLFSIVIPTCARVDLLRRCLASVTQQAPAGTEILVVDDASVAAAASAVARSFPGVRVLRLARRSGFAVAANAGIRSSDGAIVQLLNDDTEVTAGWAEHALARFTDPRVGAVAPLVLSLADRHTIDSAGDRYYLGGVAAKRGHGQPLRPDFLQARPVFGASASSGFFRRSALLQVGLFPESFGSYFEDVDLAFRLQRAGYLTWFEPRSRVLHLGAASFEREGRRLREQQSRNEERVFWRNVPWPLFWRAMPKHAAVLAGKAVRRWREGSLAPFLFGRLRVLAEIPSLWRHRRSLAFLGPAHHGAAHVEDVYWDKRWL